MPSWTLPSLVVPSIALVLVIAGPILVKMGHREGIFLLLAAGVICYVYRWLVNLRPLAAARESVVRAVSSGAFRLLDDCQRIELVDTWLGAATVFGNDKPSAKSCFVSSSDGIAIVFGEYRMLKSGLGGFFFLVHAGAKLRALKVIAGNRARMGWGVADLISSKEGISDQELATLPPSLDDAWRAVPFLDIETRDELLFINYRGYESSFRDVVESQLSAFTRAVAFIDQFAMWCSAGDRQTSELGAWLVAGANPQADGEPSVKKDERLWFENRKVMVFGFVIAPLSLVLLLTIYATAGIEAIQGLVILALGMLFAVWLIRDHRKTQQLVRDARLGDRAR